ncbi:MAG: RlmE family RNA methyltransferase [Deltaproteobacteria bacterium]|nr:RlmE family RNA methyltransferase [Deltaproteobacteria bacterium]MBW2393220.1 RlmE family RNA methyltransferase [Deltaproteobacteria bacterium]
MARYDRKDSYHQRAKREGYRSRAAYKLLELQEAQRVLRPGQRVADLGCWPGGWLQVAAQIVGPKGRVVGVDLAEMDPLTELANVFAFTGDITEPAVLERVLDELGGRADVLLSDAAPKLTGVRATDRAHEELLLEAIETAIPALLTPGGSLLVKLLDCPEAQAFQKRMRSQFGSVRVLKPKASRKGTTEKYLLGRA